MDASISSSERRTLVRPLGAVHQFHPACQSGDGITNGLFLTQKLLRGLGYESEIFCEHIAPELVSRVHHPSKLEDRPGDVLLVHHSLGYRNARWLKDVRARKVLVYHNITPDFLLPEGDLRELSRLGRDQLQELRPLFEMSIGDSEENADELRALGYRNVRVLPLLVDLSKYQSVQPNRAVIEPLQDTVNILFVGRIADNKRQADLVDCFNLFHRYHQPRSKLLLVGSTTSRGYLAQIKRKVSDLGLEDAVVLSGKVSDEDLVAYYQAADVYLSLSEHEGFGMPLIEAMTFGVPVVAHASASIPWTVGAGGLLLQTRDPEQVAATLDLVVTHAGLRRAMRRGARRSLGRFSTPVLEHDLARLLHELGGKPVAGSSPTTDLTPAGQWRVEGPFDSSYSLAIVNRNFAQALSETGTPTGVLSTEGYGDFPANPDFLQRNPRMLELAETGRDAFHQDVTLRFCYPPRTEGMYGLVRAIHSYGWEETGFPKRYVNWFNQRLDLITVLSKTVKKVLMDSGVKVPIAVVGAGSDHLPEGGSLLPRPSGAPFRFLHVSSCFPRKAPDVLLEAWRQAFTRADHVTLLIKTFPNPHHSMDAEVAAFRAKYPDAAHVEVINADLSDDEIARLYRSADAYVGAGRGEGYGLPLAEAMRHRLPVITTAWGGQTDFCDEHTSWLVDYEFAHSRSHLVDGVSLWAEPRAAHLASRLRELFLATPEERRQRTDRAHARITTESTWGQVAHRTQAAVHALGLLPQFDPELRVGWLTTWNSRCGIAEYSRYILDALPHSRGPIFANRTSDLLAEDGERVSRCWDSGRREERLDEVYEQACAQGIDALVIQYNFGFFRLPVLANLITRLRAKGIAVYCVFHSTAPFQHGDEHVSLGDIRATLAQATRLFVHSVPDLNRLREWGLVENASMLLHGVPTPRRVVPPSGPRVIGSFGFLLPGKGLPQLVDAFALLARTDSTIRLKLVNALYPASVSNDEHARLLAQVQALGLEGRVEIESRFLSEEEALDRLADVSLLVFPYQATRESSSAAVRLGIAAGRPVAVTPLSIFEDVREAAFTLPGITPPELAEGISELLSRDDLEAQSLAMTTKWSAPRRWNVVAEGLQSVIEACAVNERFERALTHGR
jgi:glycosyltransferase involved in cell wall biosynthesis